MVNFMKYPENVRAVSLPSMRATADGAVPACYVITWICQSKRALMAASYQPELNNPSTEPYCATFSGCAAIYLFKIVDQVIVTPKTT